MNRHEQELLDKQLWGVSPTPPQSGVMGLAFVAAFLGGLVMGGGGTIAMSLNPNAIYNVLKASLLQ